ncbi:transposase [Chitinivorax tropicus]|uniref:Transposase n=1 Tax=Chitinivorax tropicus TaxID=714531 RepID=A0A840MCV0_9PROT|nr:transposase [Chitinivorax tropicus]
MDFYLWSRAAVRELIRREYGIELGVCTVTHQGKMRWMIIDKAFNADRLIEFLASLIKETERKVFLIWDNLRVHHSKPVKAWLAERTAQIEVFYLSSYSPELNLEERLNADLKQAMEARTDTYQSKIARSTMNT